MWSDLLQLIPQNLKQKVLDTIVDVVSEQAKKYAGEGLSAKVKKLRSDAAFRNAFEEGLSQAMQRFVEEYQIEDEDLVMAISREQDFFLNKEVQTALTAILKQPGAYLDEEREEVLQTFTTVLPERINRERVDRAVSHLLKCLAQELWHLPELLPIYSLQFQRITAESAREQVNLQKAQLQALTSLNTGVSEALLQLTDAIVEQKLLSADSTLKSNSWPKVLHNLPQPDYEEFIGREAEQTQIHSLLRPHPYSRHYLIVIDGIGGIGKSALALEIAHYYLRNYNTLPAEERFEAIIWTSAKNNVLTADGIAPRRQIMRTLDDTYTAIAVALQRDDITRAQSDDEDEIVRRALTQQRTLLLVDNFETVDDEDVLTFLREIPDPTKVIMTTRHRIDIAYPIRLLGMSWDEAQALIGKECARKAVKVTEVQSRQLYERTGGIPLAIVWSIAQIGIGYSIEAVLMRLEQHTGSIAKFCFEEVVSQIRDKPAYKLLIALALFKTDASRLALGYVSNLSILERDEGLVELVKLSLINKSGERFYMLPLTVSYCLSEPNFPTLKNELQLRQAIFYLDFLEKQHLPQDRVLDQVQPEFNNIFSIMEWCFSEERYEEFAILVRRIEYFLWIAGNWKAWNEYTERGLKIALSLNQKPLAARLMRSIAAMRQSQGELEKAEDLTIQALTNYAELGDFSGQAVCLKRLADIQVSKGKPKEARETLSNALNLATTIDDQLLLTRIQRSLTEVDIIEGKLNEAYDRIESVRKTLEVELKTNRGLATTYHFLGRIMALQHNYRLAEEYFSRSLNMSNTGSSPRNKALTLYYLAKMEYERGSFSKARELVEESSVIFSDLGLESLLLDTTKLMDQIDSKIANPI